MGTEYSNKGLKKALQLAYFIHGEKATAVEITVQALTKLAVAAQAQDKRLYYTPGGRASSRVARTKVSLSEYHLLQRLIYVESEPYEKNKEKKGLSGGEDMIIHFIKHLVKVTLKRNSFYVALGVSRLLHNYSTAETMEIYNLTVQDPERVRDDYYYRSRKARLMAELKERFGDAVRATRVNRGEERFESDGLSSSHSPLVNLCLAYFTPWTTPCVIPATFDPVNEIIHELCFNSEDPDAEHTVEVNRIHSIIHPDCYLRLVQALKYDAPTSRLDIPRFLLSENSQRPPHNGDPGDSNWSDDEIAEISRRLNDESSRRKGFSARTLRVKVDGVEQAVIDLRRTDRVQFEIGAGAELLEVVGSGKNGETLLATRLLDDQAFLQGDTAIRLEGGQEIRFHLTPVFDSLNEVESATVEVAYRETSPLRAAALAWQQRMTSFWTATGAGGAWGWVKPAVAFATVALLVAGLWFFAARNGTPPSEQLEATGVQPTPAPEQQSPPSPPPNQEVPEQQLAEDPLPQPEEKTGPKRRAPKALDELETITDSGTRGGSKLTGVALAEVKSIAVDVQGDEGVGREVLKKLSDSIAASQRFELADRETADARLIVSIKREAAHVSFNVRLANATGYVIFPDRRERTGRKYTGTPDEVASKVLRDLNTEIERQKGRRGERE